MISPIMPVDVSTLDGFICFKKQEGLENISNIPPDERDRYSQRGEYSVKMELYSRC